MHTDNYLNELKLIYKEFYEFDKNKVPLCAAETYLSEFVRQGLSSKFEGKYIQGYKNRIIEKDNIGSDKIFPLLCLVEKICKELFHADYVDSRTLSGMNCMSILLMAIIDKKSTVVISTKEMGGHPSLANILDNLGINYLPIPYDFETYQVDYEKLNKLLQDEPISFLIFCQSDIISPPEFSKIHLPDSTGLIYDASQTLGLIAANCLDNPLDYFDKAILIGGTHKTLPGPTCGLIMTNNKQYIHQLDYTISPTLLRNIQPNNIASLCLALIEQKEVGNTYQNRIIYNANLLGKRLEFYGIKVVHISSDLFTKTHQLFLEFTEETTHQIYSRALEYNITLNKRVSKLYTGIRIGVQEITRYGYTPDDIEKVAKLISLLAATEQPNNELETICDYLATIKNPMYVLDDIFME